MTPTIPLEVIKYYARKKGVNLVEEDADKLATFVAVAAEKALWNFIRDADSNNKSVKRGVRSGAIKSASVGLQRLTSKRKAVGDDGKSEVLTTSAVAAVLESYSIPSTFPAYIADLAPPARTVQNPMAAPMASSQPRGVAGVPARPPGQPYPAQTPARPAQAGYAGGGAVVRPPQITAVARGPVTGTAPRGPGVGGGMMVGSQGAVGAGPRPQPGVRPLGPGQGSVGRPVGQVVQGAVGVGARPMATQLGVVRPAMGVQSVGPAVGVPVAAAVPVPAPAPAPQGPAS